MALFRKSASRFFYIDPGLSDNLGHHANSCRAIIRELRGRNIDPTVLAFTRVIPALQAELGAQPFFRNFTYWNTDGDPISGWLNHFDKASQETWDDLVRLGNLTRRDIVYVNSAQAIQLMAVARWLEGLPPRARPRMALELGTAPGLETVRQANGIAVVAKDPRIDPQAVLYRFSAKFLARIAPDQMHIATFDVGASAAYSSLLQREVTVLPNPRQLGGEIRSRRGRRPVTVAVLGHQRPEKGYHLMPEVVRGLLAADADLNILVHNGAPGEMADVQSALRGLAAGDRRLRLDERTAGEAEWHELLQSSDLILCPYDRDRFAFSYSAIASEAVAEAIPLVVPEGTSMARLVRDFGGAGTIFADTEPGAIVDAVLQAVQGFDSLSQIAVAAAGRWREGQGPKAFVDALLDLVG